MAGLVQQAKYWFVKSSDALRVTVCAPGSSTCDGPFAPTCVCAPCGGHPFTSALHSRSGTPVTTLQATGALGFYEVEPVVGSALTLSFPQLPRSVCRTSPPSPRVPYCARLARRYVGSV
jgi:hypothetical protein